jgi:serine/threonine-protein kinase
LDFGISKLTAPGSTSDMGMTKTSTVMGSPLYMSPEQMSSTRSVDARTDIWAMGIILYEVLTGRVPFEAETMPQLCGMILQDPPRPLRESRQDVPDALQWVVMRCLEKNRDARFSSVAELAAALVPFGPQGSQRSAERIARVLGGVASGAYSAPQSAVARTGAATDGNFDSSRDPKKSRNALFLALPLLVLAIGGGAFFALRKHAIEPVAGPGVSAQVTAPASTALPAVAPAPVPTVASAPTVAPVPPVTVEPSPEKASAPSAHPAIPKGKPTLKGKPATGAKPSGPTIDPLDGRQ